MREITYTTRNLVSTVVGDSSILITCPHGGDKQPGAVPKRGGSTLPHACQGNFNKLADSFTSDITKNLAEKILRLSKKKPYVVLVDYHRKYIDANRSKSCAYEAAQAKKFYREYHTKIASFIRRIQNENRGDKDLVYHFDIHGTAGISKIKKDMIIGTNNGKSISRLLKINPNALWDDNGLIKLLMDQGYSISPKEMGQKEDPKFNGGFTVTTYGSSRRGGSQAIQIEIAPSIRKTKDKRELFEENLAKSIIRFSRPY
jgi:N-formylglutamate amidohydrolase